MSDSYTIKELSEILSCSLPVARKKVEMNEFASTTKRIHGRAVKSYFIATVKLNELIKEVEENKRIYSKDNEVLQETPTEVLQGDEEVFQESFNQPAEEDMQHVASNELVSIMKEFSEQLRSTYESHQQRLDEAHKKLFLVEDSENRTKREFMTLQARVTELENTNKKLLEENEVLKNQIAKLKDMKWWQRKI